jgi:hypothetical protein
MLGMWALGQHGVGSERIGFDADYFRNFVCVTCSNDSHGMLYIRQARTNE